MLEVVQAFWEADIRTVYPMTMACWQEASARGARTPRPRRSRGAMA